MLRGAALIAASGAVFTLVSTLTPVEYSLWIWMNSAFGMLVMGTAFFVATGRDGRASFVRGFGAAALGALAFVSFLLVWVYAARAVLVQLPFEHFDVASSGMPTVAGYLDAGGWRDFWQTTVFSWALMLVLLAFMAAAGVVFERIRARVAAGGRRAV